MDAIPIENFRKGLQYEQEQILEGRSKTFDGWVTTAKRIGGSYLDNPRAIAESFGSMGYDKLHNPGISARKGNNRRDFVTGSYGYSSSSNDTADVTRTCEYTENQSEQLKEDVRVLKELIKKEKILTRVKGKTKKEFLGLQSTVRRTPLFLHVHIQVS